MEVFKQRHSDGSRPDIFGYLLYWDLDSSVRVNHNDLEKALIAHGFEGSLPRKISPISAFKRALEEIRHSYGKSLVIPKVQPLEVESGVTSSWTSIQELDRDSDNMHDHYRQRNAVQFTHTRARQKKRVDGKLVSAPREEEIKIDFEQHSDLTKEIVEKYDELANWHNSEDIRSMVMNILRKKKMIKLNKKGGVYFIPFEGDQTEQFVDTIESLVNKNIGGTTNMRNIELVKSRRQRRILQSDIEETIVAEVESLVRGYRKSEDDGGEEQKGLEKRLESLEDLEARVFTYEKLLEYKIVQANDALGSMKGKLQKNLLDFALGNDVPDTKDKREAKELQKELFPKEEKKPSFKELLF